MSEGVEVVVGVIGRAHGVRGEVAVEIRTDEPQLRFATGQVLRSENGDRELVVVASREHSGRLLVRFDGVPDRTRAEALRGVRLVVDVDPAERPAAEGEFYDRQLVGLRALTATGERAGTVAAVVHLPHQDLLEIDTDSGLRLVPFVEALVPVVDLAAGVVRLADVPGLLDELEDELDDELDDELEDEEPSPG